MAFSSPVAFQSCTSQRSIFSDAELEGDFQSSNIQFTLESYKRLVPMSSNGNLFFSPFSVSVAMSMVLLGAKEQTLEQLIPALSLQSLGHRVHEAYKDYTKAIMKGNENLTLKTANRLYPNNNITIVPSFLEQCRKHYLSDIKAMDYSPQYESARKEINDWVSEKTANKIKDLLPPGSLDSLTRMVLVNAIYFKGNWATKFDDNITRKMKFHTLHGQQKDVDMMFHDDTKFPMKHDEFLKCDVLELPYKGRDLSLLVILPEDTLGLPSLEAKLTPSVLQGLMTNMIPVKIEVFFQKFKLESGFELSSMFKSMGIKDLFDVDKADLSGMDASRQTFVSAIFHKAFVDVNEKGTEAAAATAAVMLLGCARPTSPPLRFKADHPFLFVIKDNRANTVLFTGRLVDPAT